jgi:hypothetical protein
MEQALLVVYFGFLWNVNVQHKQCHGNCEDAIAKGGETFQTAACNAIVGKSH